MTLAGTKLKASALEGAIADESTFKPAIVPLYQMLLGQKKQRESGAFALTRIASCSESNCAEIVRAGGIAPPVKMLKDSSEEKHYAVGVLAHIARLHKPERVDSQNRRRCSSADRAFGRETRAHGGRCSRNPLARRL